jgi:3',5'-cyclic AMP phosphodiesterase CpdA
VQSRRQFLITAGTVLLAATGCARLKLPVGASPVVPAPDAGDRPFRVALLSDPHTQEAGSLSAVAVNGKLARAVADYKALKPDIWLCNGDIADTGTAAQHDAFKKVLSTVTRPEQMLVTTGNHEFYDKEASDGEELRRFTDAFGLQKPYSHRVAGGIHFVMLADEMYKQAPKNGDWAWLTPEQLRWFEQVLAENRDKFTVVCLHQPLQDTIVWSFGNNNFAGCGQISEIRAIVKKNPQVKLWLSGHTHMGAEIPGNIATKDGVAYVGLGSTFYQFTPSEAPEDQGGWPGGSGFRKDLSASESRFLEVWPDRVVVKARDHARQAWIDSQALTILR